jgi:hypothetical protein
MDFHHPLTITMADTMTIGSFEREYSKLVNANKALSWQIW